MNYWIRHNTNGNKSYYQFYANDADLVYRFLAILEVLRIKYCVVPKGTHPYVVQFYASPRTLKIIKQFFDFQGKSIDYHIFVHQLGNTKKYTLQLVSQNKSFIEIISSLAKTQLKRDTMTERNNIYSVTWCGAKKYIQLLQELITMAKVLTWKDKLLMPQSH